MATSATYTEKELNSTARDIRNYTQNLSQTLKLLGGMYNMRWESGMTTDEWFAAHGVVRAEGKGYTPKNIYEAWHPLMWLEGEDPERPECAMFKNQRAYYAPFNNNDGTPSTEGRHLLYTREDAEKVLAGETGIKPITRYTLCPIGKKWSMNIIMKGLKQCRKYDKEAETAKKSEETVAAITEYCYIVETNVGDTKKPKGQRTYEIRTLSCNDRIVWA